MSQIYIFIFITCSLLIIASLSCQSSQLKETFGNNDYPNFGRPIHIRLPSSCRKGYISSQGPSGHGELGCTQVPCPDGLYDVLPEEVIKDMPQGFQNNITCWKCCNYDNYSNYHGVYYQEPN